MAVAMLDQVEPLPEAERFGVAKSKTPTLHPTKGGTHDPGDSMVSSMGREGMVTAPLNPEMMLLLRAIEGMNKISEPLSALVKQPGNKGPIFVALVASLLFSVVFSIGAVWVHDQSTGGRIGSRLEDHDKAIASATAAITAQGTLIAAQATSINALADVVGGLIDEGESDMDWMEEALASGFAGRPIPKRSTAGRNRLRRMLPSQ